MAVISNGSNKFHLAPAAAEAEKHGWLELFLTAGYPTPATKRILRKSRLSRHPRCRRLLAREERGVPPEKISAFWLPEFLLQAAGALRVKGCSKRVWQPLDALGYQLYAAAASPVLKKCRSRIYHYRSGYGGTSVIKAKQKGMTALCDHSIAHPSVLSCLVRHKGAFPPPGTGRPEPPLERLIHKDLVQADHVLVNSDWVKRTFLYQGWPEEQISVLYLGVDDQFFRTIPRRPESANQNPRPFKLLFAGAMTKRKGAEDIIQAFRLLGGAHVELSLAGGMDPGLRRRHRDFFENPRVKVHGILPRRELARMMTEHPVFLFPSYAEGSARVIFEAMACGCYVITTPNAGSIVETDRHGKIIPPGRPDKLAEAVREIMAHPELAAAAGRANAKLIREKHRQRDYGRRLCALYAELAGKRKMLAGLSPAAAFS